MMRTQPFWVMGQEAQPLLACAFEPLRGSCVQRMIGIQQRDQHIDVQQRAHQ